MPHHKSCIKRLKTAEKARKYNKKFKAAIKAEKDCVVKAENKEEAQKHLKNAYSILDKASVKGIIKNNKAARTKSKLTKAVESI